MMAFICICSDEYLGYYDILYKSIKKYIPKATQILYYIGDSPPTEYDQVVDITNWPYNTSYNKLERICSLRAKVVLDAFEKGYEQVIFTGAKVEFFKWPYSLIEPLDTFNAIVTPHILEPLPDDGRFPSNSSVSFTGHISTDIISFKNCLFNKFFLLWQDEIMQTRCKTTSQTYLDQSWLNFLPFFVDNVHILRDPDYNVAYWNYHQRYSNDNHDSMVCFQYSGLDLDNPERISTHQNRYKAEGKFLEFLQNYADRVKSYVKK